MLTKLIKPIDLPENVLINIVDTWYTKGTMSHIIQNEDGIELCEFYDVPIISKKEVAFIDTLSELDIILCVIFWHTYKIDESEDGPLMVDNPNKKISFKKYLKNELYKRVYLYYL